MKLSVCTFLLLGVMSYITVANATGFLKAESFPGTFQDLSFEARLDVLADGYDAFETQFDSNGVCISGCPYRGITVQEMQRLSNENTLAGNAQIQQLIDNRVQSEPSVPTVVAQAQSGVGRACQKYTDAINSGNIVPVQAPLEGNLLITSDYGPRTLPVNGATSQHNGIDLSATIGTPVYSPATGVITELPGGACGLGVVVDHGGGWTTKYCHLDQRTVDIGNRVQAGCQIGTVGNTGVSTGPHLHYAIAYNGMPFDPLYRENRLGRMYRMDNVSPARPTGAILPGRI